MITIESRLRSAAKVSLATIACVVGFICGSGALEVVYAPAPDESATPQVTVSLPQGPILASRGSQRPKSKPALLYEGVAEITAYTACDGAGMRCDGIAANGAQARAWITVAAWSAIPFGSRVVIDGLGEFIVEDRGGAIQFGRIDVYVGFDAKKEAFEFGRQRLNVRIFSPE